MALRVLFTTQPGLGHLFPLLPVADGLRRRGHDVAFATSASFAPDVAAAGHAHFAAGLDWVTADMAQRFPEIASVAPGPERYAAARKVVFAGRTAIDAVPDLLAAAERWRPDLIVHEAAEYGGPLCAELLGLPHTVVRSDSGSSSYADRRAVADALAETRRHVGLPPDPDVEMPFRYLQLSFAPPGLDESRAGGCADVSSAAADRNATDRDGTGAAMARRPTAAAATARPSTSRSAPCTTRQRCWRRSSRHSPPEPLDLLMTVGPGEDPEQLGPQPANVHIARWIPQDEVLPHCDAVITHGGYGTVSAALRNGLPLVVVPISADQPLNARRVQRARGQHDGRRRRTQRPTGSGRPRSTCSETPRTGKPRSASPPRRCADPISIMPSTCSRRSPGTVCRSRSRAAVSAAAPHDAANTRMKQPAAARLARWS